MSRMRTMETVETRSIPPVPEKMPAMDDASRVIIRTTFFISDDWSLVETVDFKLKVLQRGRPIKGCEWNPVDMSKAVAAYRRLTASREGASETPG